MEIKHIHIPAGSDLQYVAPGSLPFRLREPLPDEFLADCVVEGDAIYIPAPDNPHFILLKAPNDGQINSNTQIV